MSGHISSSAPESDPAAVDQAYNATQSVPVAAADAGRVHSPTFSQPHLIHDEEDDDELEEFQSLVPNPGTASTSAAESTPEISTGMEPRDALVEDRDENSVEEPPIVHSPTFSEPHLVYVEDDDEESVEGPAVPNPHQAARARARESAHGRQGPGRPALRMNATPRDEL